jgi:hypothetical protein
MHRTRWNLFPVADAASPEIPRYVTLVGLCYPLSGVCRVLAKNREEVLDQTAHGHLVAIPAGGGDPYFPVWQFPHGHLLPHLVEMLKHLPLERMGPWETALWFTRPRRPLQGRCVAAWLERGGDPDLIRTHVLGIADAPSPEEQSVGAAPGAQ